MSPPDRMAADLSRTGAAERDIEQAITALKKGAYLLKYGRRGKPKFCPFRLSNDESVLIWFSGKEEKHLKLSHISRIISGQRTPIFQRYPRPEKEYQSFSLIYNDRSLDLICKDKDEAEVWFSGLKALISRSHNRKWRTESRSDGIQSEVNSPRTYTRRSSPLNSPFGSNDSFQKGEGTGEGVLGGGVHRAGNCFGVKMDSLLPKALESTVVLDVQNIACGSRHAALVSKQGEIFSWGEESGGRLGHGVDSDVMHPKLLDTLSNTNIELVACGEYHTCAVTLSGDLYTWGDGTYNFGLLGHGNVVSHWVPKRVNGPLEGIHVSSISCGPWHTAVVTSSGQLFTFGDGTFGVLGHGDRKSVSLPREVESLKGLRTVRASCGVWHTAAVVEVMVGNSSSSNCSSGKLFTWGDGDKGRLGHGDKEAKLVPTCVAALVEPNFCRVACGHSLTVALTTSGQIYTMGSPVYGQLGNPHADGKLPARVEVFCHSCSSKKSHKASMAPNPHKPYRVCDTCFNKLGKAMDTEAPSSHSSISRRGSINHGSNEFTDKDEKLDSRSRSQLARFSSMESFKQTDSRSKKNKKLEFNSSRVSPIPNRGSQWGGLNISKSFNPMLGSSKKFFSASVPGSRIVSRATSPISRRPSPPRSTTPTPTLGGLTSPKISVDDTKTSNDGISQEVTKLRAQVLLLMLPGL
ncbi:unnamed protein product [Linum tenue]|uniref:PH domain-containing protein n=1 Tax=Linum tenue TaxID=586396 RepID=A0AAV0QUJ0_9ROSI|nr:unnamed protein product [Linum tenue]